MIKNGFVCGYKDIENKGYAGSSRKHEPDGNAVETTNGAGPHNIQIFVLAPDGTVMTCLPGYWRSEDLARELTFAQQLYQLWSDPGLSIADKKATFTRMQLDHIAQHPQAEHKRSRMQGFDIKYEASHRPYATDVFYQRTAIDPSTGSVPPGNVKPTDIIMHERMAARPFVAYKDFDVARFSDYGKPMYDKNEDMKIADGETQAPSGRSAPMIGNDPRAHPIKTQMNRQSKAVARRSMNYAIRYGLRALLR